MRSKQFLDLKNNNNQQIQQYNQEQLSAQQTNLHLGIDIFFSKQKSS